MNDPDGSGERSKTPATSDDAELSARLDSIRDRLAARRTESGNDRQGARNTDAQGLGLGIRVVTDIVAGTLLGGGLGWLADSLLGTSPWGLIVMLMFGVAAGVLLALRTAGLVQEQSVRLRSAGRDEEDRGERG